MWGQAYRKRVQTGIERTYEINRHIVGGDGRSWIQRSAEADRFDRGDAPPEADVESGPSYPH